MATDNKKVPTPEEIKTHCKEAQEKLASHIKEGIKVGSEVGQIIHRNVLTAQKELLEHHIGRLEAHLKKLDAELAEASGAPSKKR